MKLSTHITIRLIIPLLFGAILMTSITTVYLNDNIPKWTDKVGQSINKEELQTLTLRTKDRANLAKETFLQFSSDIKLIRDYALELFNNQLPVTEPYTNYFGTDNNQIPDPLEETVWYIQDRNNFDNTYLDQTTTMENVWKTMMESNPSYTGLYIGMKNGFYRYYPYTSFNNYPNLVYTCASSGSTVTGYDPRCRNWYHLATQNLEEVIFTEPYNDATTGKVLISVSHAIVVNNELIGVVSVDISMDTLSNLILSTRVLNDGYAFIIDNTGTAVVYPNLNRDRIQKIENLEFEDNEQDKTNFSFTLNQMLSGETGQVWYNKGKNKWNINYKAIDRSPYRIGLVVPKSNIDKPTNDIKDSAESTKTKGVTALICVLVAMLIILFFGNLYIVKRMVAPISELIDQIDKMTKSDLDIEMGNKAPVSAEISTIYNNFTHLILALRFGNEQYYGGNLKKAFDNYLVVEQMMTQLKNERGKGVCLNNKGNVLKQMKDKLHEARDCYIAAIENAQKLQSRAEKDNNDHDVNVFKIVLGNRLMNLGVFYKDLPTPNLNESEKLFKEALELHRETDHLLGIAKISGNLGQLYLQQSRNLEARQAINDGFNLVKDRGDSISLQYAAMNEGLLESVTNVDLGIQWFRYALDCSQELDKYVQHVSLVNLSKLYEQKGDHQIAQNIRAMIPGGSEGPKDVLFVLDTSGSMAGRPINLCRNSLTKIVTEYTSDNDFISLTTFGSRVNKIFPLIKRGQNFNKIIHDIKEKTRTGEMTAFYDAMMTAIETMDNIDNHRPNWIIALTDGCDNRSKHSAQDVCNRLNGKDLHVIVITVGNLPNEDEIKSICNSVGKKGLHIPAEGGVEGIEAAFSKVAKLIVGQSNVETL